MHLFSLFKKKENIISKETYYNNLININEINDTIGDTIDVNTAKTSAITNIIIPF